MTRSKAINQMCRECIYDPDAEGTWRAQVEACTRTVCPLYPYRPVRTLVKTPKSPSPGSAE